MKRLAVVLALVAMSACQKAEQQQTQTPADTSHMMMSDTSKMMMVDTSMHVMKADTSKRMIAPNKPAPKKKKP
jgi:nitrous oxide reductase accessory protein NosL